MSGPAGAGADGLAGGVELVAAAGLLGPAGRGGGAALLGRGLGAADLPTTVAAVLSPTGTVAAALVLPAGAAARGAAA